MCGDGWGRGSPRCAQRALESSGTDAPLTEFVGIVTQSYRQHRLERTAPFPGVPKMLAELAAGRILMAILTNKPHEHTVPMTTALFPDVTFVAVEGYRLEERRKPDPRTAWEIVERMNLPRDQVALVGDSATDMRTAVNAGLIPIGATWGYRSREELIDAGAIHLIDAPSALISWIDKVADTR